jgi:hypothetical protein
MPCVRKITDAINSCLTEIIAGSSQHHARKQDRHIKMSTIKAVIIAKLANGIINAPCKLSSRIFRSQATTIFTGIISNNSAEPQKSYKDADGWRGHQKILTTCAIQADTPT